VFAVRLTLFLRVSLRRYFSLFLLMASMVVLVLIGLTVMRSDAERLVLFPLQRMLMIVVRCKYWFGAELTPAVV